MDLLSLFETLIKIKGFIPLPTSTSLIKKEWHFFFLHHSINVAKCADYFFDLVEQKMKVKNIVNPKSLTFWNHYLTLHTTKVVGFLGSTP